MSSSENAKLQYESGQTSYPMEVLSDSGDHIIFDSNAALFSGAAGKEPDVKPDGLATGGVVTVAVSSSDDVVDVAALTCYLAGVKKTVSSGLDTAITRAATDVASISSITVNSSGTIAVVKGTDSADTTFSETRDAAGGPPLIPVGSIEIAQIRTTTNTAGPISANEIFQVIGLHQERYDFPLFTVVAKDAQIVMADSLSLIHVGATTKAVNASYADPIFADVPKATNYKPSETSHTVNSEQIYGGTLGSTSKSLGQGSFTAYFEDGITDPLLKAKNDTIWFKFFQNKYKSSYMLDQGVLGIARDFPAGGDVNASCTISASTESFEVEV